MKKFVLPEINVCEFKAVDVVTVSGYQPEPEVMAASGDADYTFASSAGVEYVG